MWSIPMPFYERPIPERHRILFYLGHLEAFDWNLIGRALDVPAFDADFDQLFSFGIDPGADHLPDRPAAGLARRRCSAQLQ
jgi:iron(II)-dependent oxidoreductase